MNGLPVFLIETETCADAWIEALRKVFFLGKNMKHQYYTKDKKKETEWSKEATVIINVSNPLKELRFHFADDGAFHEIEYKMEKEGYNYVTELLEGTFDDRVDKVDHPLSYTYHRRLFAWGRKTEKHDKQLRDKKLPLMDIYKQNGGRILDMEINQFDNMIDKAVSQAVSRKLQMITWLPHKDMHVKGSPCLQRIWIRLLQKRDNPDEYDGIVLEVQFRSRDLFWAWGSNCYGLVELGKLIADTLSKKMSMKIELKQYLDYSNSLHVYQKDYTAVENKLKAIESREQKLKLAIIDNAINKGDRCFICRRGKVASRMKCNYCGASHL